MRNITGHACKALGNHQCQLASRSHNASVSQGREGGTSPTTIELENHASCLTLWRQQIMPYQGSQHDRYGWEKKNGQKTVGPLAVEARYSKCWSEQGGFKTLSVSTRDWDMAACWSDTETTQCFLWLAADTRSCASMWERHHALHLELIHPNGAARRSTVWVSAPHPYGIRLGDRGDHSRLMGSWAHRCHRIRRRPGIRASQVKRSIVATACVRVARRV